MLLNRITSYIILDYALNAFFKGIQRNFIRPKNVNFFVGMKIKEIRERLYTHTRIYRDCVITDIDSDGDMNINYKYAGKVYNYSNEEIELHTNNYDIFHISELIYVSEGIFNIDLFFH